MPRIIGEKIEGEITIRVGKNGILVREQTQNWIVEADSAFQDQAEILLTTPGLPQFGAIYGSGMVVKSIRGTRDPMHRLRWSVAATGSSEVQEDQNQNPQNQGGDPTTWIPIASVKFEPYEHLDWRDLSDPRKVYENSAKRPFGSALQFTRRIAAVPFTQFEPISTTLDSIMDRCDTINSATYKGKDEDSLLLSIEEAQIGFYSGYRCWRVDYTMRYREESWKIQPIDEGWEFIDGGTHKDFYREQWASGTYDSSKPGITPFVGKLDGSGGALSNQNTGTPQFLTFYGHKRIDFNSFLRLRFV